jgi:hypothetical protein
VLANDRSTRLTLLVADSGPALDIRQMMLSMRAAIGRVPRLMPVPARVLRIPAQLAGGGGVIDRLAGPLVVDISRLKATGAAETIHSSTGLYLWMQREALLSARRRQH